jgi:hypothetical protein
LRRNKAHVLAFNGLGNRLRVDEVILVRLHEWPYRLRRINFTSLPAQCAAQKVRPGSGFHANQARLHLRGEINELLLPKTSCAAALGRHRSATK